MLEWIRKLFGFSKTPMTTFDERSEKNIATLLPPAQAAARRWLAACLDAGLRIKIISGTRTYADQDALYAQGRSKPGRVVTNAKAGYSNHNFGIAWDFGIFGPKGEYIEEGAEYARAGEIAESQGLEWGGRWESLEDRPHIQLRTGLTLAQMRARVASGKAIV
jgi:peptidoglycan L-alanyl-D-glutamate endopeptidase CwlK